MIEACQLLFNKGSEHRLNLKRIEINKKEWVFEKQVNNRMSPCP